MGQAGSPKGEGLLCVRVEVWHSWAGLGRSISADLNLDRLVMAELVYVG